MRTSAPTPGRWSATPPTSGSPTRRPRAAPTRRSPPTCKSFDQWDRYDYDGDGNFNEPDGYIDHFQIVHAGGDQADGDPQQGEDAIWSHRWYAYVTDQGRTGPADNRLGGTQIGNTGIWIGDYTIQPENGGLSVFVHEYGHDLGLPDDYDITGGGDNNNEHWTLMAQSRLSAKDDAGIGTRAGDLGAWNKLQLGWLDYEMVVAGQKKTLKLGPQEYNTDEGAGRRRGAADSRTSPSTSARRSRATKQYFSGNDDDLEHHDDADVDLTGKTTRGAVDLKGRYNIEEDYDYLYFEASTDGGATWTAAGRHGQRRAARRRRRGDAAPWTGTQRRRRGSTSACR